MEIFLGSLLLISFCAKADEDLFTGYKVSSKNHSDRYIFINLNDSQNSAEGLRRTLQDNNKHSSTRTSIVDNMAPGKSKWYFQKLLTSDISSHGKKKDLSNEMSLRFEPERRIPSASLRYSRSERLQSSNNGRNGDLNKKITSAVESERRAHITRDRNSRIERPKWTNKASDHEDNNLDTKMVERRQSDNKARSGVIKNHLINKITTVFDPEIRVQSVSVRGFHTERPLTTKKICRWSPDGRRRQCLKRRKKKKLVNSVANIPGFSSKSNDSFMTNVRNTGRINGEFRKRNFRDDMSDSINARDRGGDEGRSSVNDTHRSNPCVCTWSLQNCGCECRGSLNYDNFMDLSKIFRPCKDFKFTLSGGHYYALPPNFFTNLINVHAFNMSITNATFEYLLDPTPMTSPFTGVHFSDSALITLRNVSVRRGWNWTPFQKLEGNQNARVDIFIEGCILRRLTSDFSSVASGRVGDVTIDNSNLSMIGSAAFENFVNMTSLRLPGNKITSIRREDLPRRPTKLEKIDFCNNQLRYLEDNMFTDMPALKEIALSGNPFKVLSEKTFHDVITRVNLVGISDFPLNCNCELQWLKDPNLVDNEMIKKNMVGATCRKPRYLLGTPFQNLAKEHLVCQ